MEITEPISRELAEQCLQVLKAQFAEDVAYGFDPRLYEPGFHSPHHWVIAADGYSHIEWADLALRSERWDSAAFHNAYETRGVDFDSPSPFPAPAGVFVEPINHWSIGLYPAQDPAEIRAAIAHAAWLKESPFSVRNRRVG
jgi:hypothetical protein